ncbi:MAG: response regulator [Actinobacteria bacterium]|uniref:histidine kinase n=1 Tax=freshwater metagenome TaxID=449393 RepID=A0A6J6RG22_9ZZZZ|nr:response regulator [Actinomycetota bacterium]
MDLAALYRNIVETSPDGIWVVDLDGRTLYANTQIARIHGISESELADLTVFDTLDAIGREQFAVHLEDLRAGRLNPSAVEVQWVRADGTAQWVLIRESPLLDDDGGCTAILNRVSDYSDRHEMVDSLRLSESRLEEAEKIARMGSWVWDVETDQVTASPGLRALYGLEEADFPMAYADILAGAHPEDVHLLDSAIQAALAGSDSLVYEVRMWMDDEWVWTRGRGVVHSVEGRTVLSGTQQDVTETKLAELALEDQVAQNDLMQAVASAANEATTLVEVLQQARSLVLLHDDWERGRAFVPEGEHVVGLYAPEDEPDDPDDPLAQVELELANAAYRTRSSHWSESLLTLACPVLLAGEVCAVVVITSAPPLYRHEMIRSMVEQVADQLSRVAERERAQRELAAARDGAMEASRQKSEFLATMSHEIRTPINGVIGLNDLLLRTALSPDQERLATGVQVASRALLGVINDILDFSKIEAGRLELESLAFEIRPLLDQVAGMLAEPARARSLDLVMSCHPDVPAALSGDPTRLAQVLTNLVSNAVKFTERGGVIVRATTRPGPGTSVELRVEVSDTGVGIPDGEIGPLFDPFTQADASTTRVFGGTGLGLAISRDIVEAMGGTITWEPNPGGGSIFTFTAMLETADDTVANAAEEHARSLLGGKRALVVDDNEHNRLILEEQLGWWEIDADSAGSVFEAMPVLAEALAAGEGYECVLLDMAMPGHDGLDLARWIRSDPAYDDVRLLMLTSVTTLDVDELRRIGIDDVLTKPVLSGVLRGALLELLVGPSAALPDPVEAGRPSAAHRVLVVEDNPVNQMVATGLLEAMGYAVVTVDDGLAAVEAVRASSYDAILMDVQMPRMDGYAATREIRSSETSRRHPIIAMTAAAVEGERERCLQAGMDDYLTKPVDPTALAATLARWLDGAPLPATAPAPARDLSIAALEGLDALAGLDLERLEMLRDLDPGNTTYLDRAIANFTINSTAVPEQLHAAVEAGDVDELKAVAHKLAGGAANLGVPYAGDAVRALEHLADTGTVDGAADLMPGVEQALGRARAALAAYQATYAEQ